LLLTVGAGLFVRSLRNVRSLDLGFDSEHVIMAGLNLPSAGISPQTVNANYERLAEKVGALPGITSISRTTSVPFYSYSFFLFKFSPQDTTPHRYKTFGAAIAAVDPGYFRTMGIKPSQGRVLEAGDVAGAPQVAVVTEGLVRDLWPGENPVGKCVIRAGSNVCAEIVGVTPDVRRDIENNDRSNIKGQVYLSLDQFSREKSPLAATALMIRVDAKSEPIMSRLSTALRAASPDSRYVIIQPMTNMLDSSIKSWSMGASMFSFFSGLALALTAIGLYGLLAYAVRQRTSEIGVRMALGAQPRDVLVLIVAQAIKLVSVGVAIGLAASLGLSKLVASLLFRVEPGDLRSYVTATAVLIVVALLACWLPARRAARIDPLQALRYE
jgi:putative ABC transport system permease protein